MAIAKKRVVRKGTPRKAVRKVATKKAVKKSVGRPKKAVTRKATPVKAARKSSKAKTSIQYGTFGDLGFTVGSDSEVIAEALIEGGADREDIAETIAKRLPSTVTRNDTDKNIPALISGMVRRLLEQGYKVESHWRVVPPKKVQNKLNKR